MPGWDETTNEIRYRIQDPQDFEQASFRYTLIKKSSPKVYTVMGKPKDGGGMTVQALRFPKDEGWDLAKAKDWAANHYQNNIDSYREFSICPTVGVEYNEATPGIVMLRPIIFGKKNLQRPSQIWTKESIIKTTTERPSVALFNGHTPNGKLIGIAKMEYNEAGYFGKAEIADTQDGRDAIALLKIKAIEEWSPGFVVIHETYDKQMNARRFKENKVDEIALLPPGFAANPDAQAHILNQHRQYSEPDFHSDDFYSEPVIHSDGPEAIGALRNMVAFIKEVNKNG
jgi:HK97 family phage prohead protease